MLIVLPDELEVLRGMQPLDRDVFNYIAERMDFETGITGKSRRISYGGIAYDLSEHDGERRSKETLRALTIDQVRNAVRRLIKQGLLQSLSEKGRGNDLILVRVFWVDCMGLGRSVKKPDASSLPDQMTVAIDFIYKQINQLKVFEQSSYQIKTRADAITSFTQQQHQGDEQFLMRLDWQPTQDEFEMILFRAGKANASINPEWIAEFVAYWYAEGKRRYSQREWTQKIAMRMVDYLRDPGQFDRLHGVNQQAASKPGQPKATGMPEWARLPREDEELTPWAMRNGYGEADQGWSYMQYRNMLRVKIEARLKQWRQLS